MKTEIKVSIITGVLAIIGGVLPVILGWYGPPNAPNTKNEKEFPPPAAQTAPATPQRITTITAGNVHYSEGDMTINNGIPAKAVDAPKPNLAAIATIIRNRDLQAAQASPVFRKLVRKRYGIEFEQLNRQQMATFWPEMAKYLSAQERGK